MLYVKKKCSRYSHWVKIIFLNSNLCRYCHILSKVFVLVYVNFFLLEKVQKQDG